MAKGRPSMLAQCEWIWFANAGRIKHLALTHASDASRRFAGRLRCLLAICAALLLLVAFGFEDVAVSKDISPVRTPGGEGWIRVVEIDEAAAADLPPDAVAALWWNFPQAIAVLITGWLSAWFLGWLVHKIIRSGTEWAHLAPFRGQERMTAALDYATAWVVPATLGVLVGCMAGVARIARAAGYGSFPGPTSFLIASSIVAGLAFVLWWFWLIRLGATAPVRTRARVVTFMAVVPALLVAGAALGWWTGLSTAAPHAWRALGLQF